MTELSVWDILKSPVVTEKSVLLKEGSSEDETIGQI
jgi:ribosomal protein L23